MNVKTAAAVTVAVVAVLYYYDLLFLTFTILAHITVGGLGIYLGVSLTLVKGKQYTPPPIPQELVHPRANLVLQNMMVILNIQNNNENESNNLLIIRLYVLCAWTY